MRMAARVHCRAAYCWTPAHPTIASGLADFDVAVIDIADLTHRRQTFLTHQSHFAAWQPDLGIFGFAPDQLGRCACRTGQLSTASGFQFNVMNQRTHRNIPQWQCIAVTQRRTGAAHQRIAYLQAQRRDDVALLAVNIVQQRDTG